MSVKVDLSEFLSAYIAEVDEQLAVSRKILVVIDAAARRGERDPRSIRELFRAMHTIKGLSAMVGVEPIVAIAHRLEAVLRELDKSSGVLSPKLADLMIECLRFVEQSVRAVEKGAAPPQAPPSIVHAFEGLAPEHGGAPGATRGARLTLDAALEQKLDPFERELLLKGALEGRRAVRLDYVPTSNRAAEGLNINTLRDRVSEVAEIVRVIPISLAASDRSPGGICFALLLLTAKTDEQLAAVAGVEVGAIRPIAETEAPSTPPPALAVREDRSSDAQVEDAPRRNLLRVDAARVDDAMERLAMLIVTRSRFARAIDKLAASGADTRELAQIASENARQLRDLRTAILQVRMVPLAEILERVPLMLRTMTRAGGHRVRLEVEAAGAELDKAVAERIFPAIVHLVRNAVDHGIERPEERVAAGKDPEGLVRITCSAQSNTRLELSIRDDGRGVDAAAVARRAGVETPPTEAALLELLCRPGFSTRAEATTTSGRGLGMDIVKRIAVDQLGGDLSMRTEIGRGTTFTLQVPLTVAIVDAFVVECAGQPFVVPVAAVEEILEMAPGTLVSPPHGGAARGVRPLGLLQRRGETVPVYALASLLGLRRDASATEPRAIVVRRAGEPVALLLDRVVGQKEAVVRPLLDPLVRVVGVPAATDLGDGRPTIVLDPVALAGQSQALAKALGSGAAHGAPALLPGVAAVHPAGAA